MQYNTTLTILHKVLSCDVTRTQLAWQDLRFVWSDSRAAARMLLGRVKPDRTGSNSRNTLRVREAGTDVCQASSLLKADGAGHTEGLSGADNGLRGISGLGYVSLE